MIASGGLAEFSGQIDRHGATEGMSVDQAFGWVRLQQFEAFPRHPRIFVNAAFRRQITMALAESSVVDGQH
ncbi:hypothetical protein D3C81_1654080 [compost metagenome]